MQICSLRMWAEKNHFKQLPTTKPQKLYHRLDTMSVVIQIYIEILDDVYSCKYVRLCTCKYTVYKILEWGHSLAKEA